MLTSTLIKKAARLLEKQANILLKSSQITHGYTYYLMVLFEKDGINQTDLQRAIGGIEQPTVVRTLDRMERDGLIIRKPNPADKRASLIYLTEKGKACEDSVNAAGFKLNQMLHKTFSNEEEKVLCSYLQRLIENMEP
jgi:MarR family transcriptional regulator, transcriptional regulator for hemolysin